MKTVFKFTFVASVWLAAVPVRAQGPGDVGSPECRALQLVVQAAVSSGGPFKNQGKLMSLVSSIVDPALASGAITPECASCITSQFARKVAISRQRTCGPVCGNAVCQRGEDSCNCHRDCASACGDGGCFQ